MLIVHHLGVSQSERVVWLCEELEIPYDLRIHKRDPFFSPPSIKTLHPIGAAPIIQDGDLTLAESAACIDYIIHKHGNGRLALGPTHKDYAAYLYWFHFSNGSLQPGFMRLMSLQRAGCDQSGDSYKFVARRVDGYVEHVEARLGSATWLAGDEFTAADIMTVFSFTTARAFAPYDLSPYPNILAYLQRVAKRPAYRRAHEKGDPGLPYMLDGPPPKSFAEMLKQ